MTIHHLPPVVDPRGQVGSVQFAVDADGALNFAVAGGGLRQELRLHSEGAAGCFQFRAAAAWPGRLGG